MDSTDLICHYLTDGIKANTKNHVGIELEFPLVNTSAPAIDLAVVEPLFSAVCALGYEIVRRDKNGLPLKAKDAKGNVFTFDTCFENIEFAMASAPDLISIYHRFRETLRAAQGALRPFSHAIMGVGYNPNIVKTSPHLVESELTMNIAEYFREHPVKRRFHKDFYCMVSSEQVHFNTTEEELPLIFETFTRLDWLNILLFADSPAHIEQKQYICARNELYMTSPFAEIGLVGAQKLGTRSVREIAESYKDICIFMRERGGKTEIFWPEPVGKYLESKDALPEDIHQLDLERNIVTTAYGTTEYRILCSQPFTDSFAPSAFNLGLRKRLSETLEIARDFDSRHEMPEPNERNRQASLGAVSFADKAEITELMQKLLEVSKKGLIERGFGEEKFLAPIYARSNISDCPAQRLLRRERLLGAHSAYLERTEIGEDII